VEEEGEVVVDLEAELEGLAALVELDELFLTAELDEVELPLERRT
jgi:hypothetical protein